MKQSTSCSISSRPVRVRLNQLARSVRSVGASSVSVEFVMSRSGDLHYDRFLVLREPQRTLGARKRCARLLHEIYLRTYFTAEIKESQNHPVRCLIPQTGASHHEARATQALLGQLSCIQQTAACALALQPVC